MTSVYLKQFSPYANISAAAPPWYLRVYAGEPMGQQLTKDQTFVRDVVERASSMTTRASMYDYLKSQRSYPMRNMQVSDSWLHRFIETELNPVQLCRIGWDQFAHYAASLPLRYVRALRSKPDSSGSLRSRSVDYTLEAMVHFPLRTVFKSYAVMGLYFFQEFESSLCTAFEHRDPVPMAIALKGLARNYVRKSRFELIAAAMMIASADGYLDAARRARGDALIQKCHVTNALRSFGLATVISLGVRDDAHCYSPDIVSSLQQYAAFMQGAIAGWQASGQV